jgi:hypothetical protein
MTRSSQLEVVAGDRRSRRGETNQIDVSHIVHMKLVEELNRMKIAELITTNSNCERSQTLSGVGVKQSRWGESITESSGSPSSEEAQDSCDPIS